MSRTRPIFQSFFMGGFECATHRRPEQGQIDVIAGTSHDRFAETDYSLLASAGVRSVRDGLRWHLIERAPGAYDWSSFLPMLKASIATGTQVVWDLCHWGVPVDLSPFDPSFTERLERFATAAARVIADHTDAVPFFCPVNEISFWSWIGGDRGVFFPYGKERGRELKYQLAAASIAATRAVRSVHPQARILHCEPIIHIATGPSKDADALGVQRHNAGQFEAWDIIAGRLAPELGGSEDCLDILGCNYYWNNQWQDRGEVMPIGHAQHRPLHELLVDIQNRYNRPLIISETGADAGAAIGWLGLICAEAREALRKGVALEAICLYPVMDYPGWDDGRHCECGLIRLSDDWQARSLRTDLAADLALNESYFEQGALRG